MVDIYVKRLEMSFVVNNVPNKKKAASLLTLIGREMYALLKSLTTPTKPTELSFTEIVEVMGRYFGPKPIVFRTASGNRTFYYRTVKLWNKLESFLKLSPSVKLFKRRSLRSQLLDNFVNTY